MRGEDTYSIGQTIGNFLWVTCKRKKTTALVLPSQQQTDANDGSWYGAAVSGNSGGLQTRLQIVTADIATTHMRLPITQLRHRREVVSSS
jgi:hypothetical protein